MLNRELVDKNVCSVLVTICPVFDLFKDTADSVAMKGYSEWCKNLMLVHKCTVNSGEHFPLDKRQHAILS
jgi:hypothetical protein